MKVYTIYDSKGEFFDRPFIQRNAADAVRGFEMVVNGDNDSMIKRFPGDYTLFEIASWDERKGELKMHDAKINLGTGLQLKKETHSDVGRGPKAMNQ